MIAITDVERPLSQMIIRHYLDQGQTVFGLVSDRHNKKNHPLEGVEGFTLIEGNVLDVFALNELIKNARFVFHTAEIMQFRLAENQRMYKFNIEGSANVFHAANVNKVEGCVFFSDHLALGDKSEGQYFDERTKWNDMKRARGYGWSKHLAEREAWRAISEGLNTLIVSPGMILGEELKQSAYQPLMAWLYDNKTFTPGAYPVIDQSDLWSIILGLIEKGNWNDHFLVFHEMISCRTIIKSLSQNRNSIELDPRPFLRLKKKAKFKLLNWFPSNGEAVLKERLLALIPEEKTLTNDKLINVLPINFTDIDVTLSKLNGLTKT